MNMAEQISGIGRMSSLLDIRQAVVYLGHMIDIYFYENYPHLFPRWLGQFTLPSAANEGSLSLTSLPDFVVICLIDLCHTKWDKTNQL